MAVIAALTGGIGFLSSYALLQVGLERMWLRYVLAVLLAYLAYFLLLRIWLRFHGRRFQEPEIPEELEIVGDAVPGDIPDASGAASEAFAGGGGDFGGGGASGSFGAPEFPVPDLDLDEAVVLVVLIAAAGAILLASVWVVYDAPTLFAELLVDTALASGLYRRLGREGPRSWILSALRRTAIPFAVILVVFGFAGWMIQKHVPGAKSIGDVVRLLRHDR